MATCNFKSMKNFPLVIRNTEDCFLDGDFDYFQYEITVEEMEDQIAELKESLIFHKIEVVSGYYTSLQYFVEEEYDLENEEWNDEDCEYYFDMEKSAAYLEYRKEIKRIRETLMEISKYEQYDVLDVIGRFSNGEALYVSAKEKVADQSKDENQEVKKIELEDPGKVA